MFFMHLSCFWIMHPETILTCLLNEPMLTASWQLVSQALLLGTTCGEAKQLDTCVVGLTTIVGSRLNDIFATSSTIMDMRDATCSDIILMLTKKTCASAGGVSCIRWFTNWQSQTSKILWGGMLWHGGCSTKSLLVWKKTLSNPPGPNAPPLADTLWWSDYLLGSPRRSGWWVHLWMHKSLALASTACCLAIWGRHGQL